MTPRKQRPKNPALAAALARAGKTEQVVAQEAGVHLNTLSRLLNRRQDATPETAQKIAAVLNVTPESLDLTEAGGVV